MKKPSLAQPAPSKPTKDVSLSLRNLPIADAKTKLKIRISGGVNDSKFHKPASQIHLHAGQLNVVSKGKGAVARTNYKKAKVSIEGLSLPRSSKALTVDVIDGVPMAALSISQGKISIGRSRDRKHMRSYSWAKLHTILGYGEQIAGELAHQKGAGVKLLVLTSRNALSVLAQIMEPDFIVPGPRRTFRKTKLLVLTGKERVIEVKRVG
jgi:hypothetical protein